MSDRIDAHIDELKVDGVRAGVAPKDDPGPGLNDAAAVRECNQEVVVLHVDPALLTGRWRAKQQRSEHATDRSHTPHPRPSPPSASSPDSRSLPRRLWR